MTALATSRTPERLAALVEMHTYSRPHRSRTERTFIRLYLRSLPGAYFDAFGNIHVIIGTSTILWSAHTDTVARVAGRQRVRMSADGVLSLAAADSLLTSGRVHSEPTIPPECSYYGKWVARRYPRSLHISPWVRNLARLDRVRWLTRSIGHAHSRYRV